MFGLLPSGFKRKQYSEIKESMETRARNLFGEDVNLAEKSPLGLFIRLFAWSTGILWQLAEKVYFSAFVDTAEGISLDNVAQYIGISRFPAGKANGVVTFGGNEGVEIPEGFLIETPDNIVFITTETVIIPAGLFVDATIEAVEVGLTGNVDVGRITQIVNPIAGLDTVTNATATVGGSNVESDALFRDRYKASIARTGSSTAASIEATLLEVEGVTDARVRENDQPIAVNGIPPKSIAPLVFGGSNQDVAFAILSTKAAGILSFGTITETVEDSRGVEFDIGFTRATEIQVDIEVGVSVTDAFPSDGTDQITSAIIQYVGGTDLDGTVYTGLRLGQDVIYTKIVALCHNVGGVTDIIALINGETTNLSILEDEIAIINTINVVVS